MLKAHAKNIWRVIRQTGAALIGDKLLKLSASLAFYTIFSLGPMLLIIIFFSNIFWGEQAIEGAIFKQTREIIGDKAALQIQEIIRNASVSGNNAFTATLGGITLFIGATTVFAEIQDSINMVWNLKAKPQKGWLVMLKSRLLSFSLIISLGFLLLVSLIINGLVEGLMERLERVFPEAAVALIYTINLAITTLITISLFAVIFKVLPDAVTRWKDVMAGAVFATILFMTGKFGITFYIRNSNIAGVYGTAGSLVILLLWVYFSAMVLYLGAEFTRFHASLSGTGIQPNSYAVRVRTMQVEEDEDEDPVNE